MTALTLQIKKASGLPFYRQVIDQIAALIRSGQLPPGARLPSVRALSQQLRVSLITVRNAYAALEAAGLIISRQGQGTFVAKEVAATSRRSSLAQARDILADAILRAQQLGLSGGELQHCLAELTKPTERVPRERDHC